MRVYELMTILGKAPSDACVKITSNLTLSEFLNSPVELYEEGESLYQVSEKVAECIVKDRNVFLYGERRDT